MKRVCTWCMKNLGDVHTDYHDKSFTTHAICKECADTLFAELEMNQIEIFLERLPEPVVVVDSDGVALTANTAAKELLGKSLHSITGFMLGDIIECKHATEPGGCGKTIHCNGCAIRMSVENTFYTGSRNLNISTYSSSPDTDDYSIITLQRIATVKADGVVILKIDNLGTAISTMESEET